MRALPWVSLPIRHFIKRAAVRVVERHGRLVTGSTAQKYNAVHINFLLFDLALLESHKAKHVHVQKVQHTRGNRMTLDRVAAGTEDEVPENVQRQCSLYLQQRLQLQLLIVVAAT